MVGYLDYQLGCIVEELKKIGVYENSVIIFTSDNGPIITGGAESDFFENASPFNPAADRLKGSVYEGGIHVPLIVSWPGKIRKNIVSDHICAAWDLFPTICDITGTAKPDDLDGISISPVLLNKNRPAEHDYLYWEYPEAKGQQALRMGKWKAVRTNIRNGNMDLMLFDLEKDIREENDVSDKYPEIVKKAEDIMAREHIKPEIKRFDLFEKR
jgi:arylsulfatase